LVIEEAKRVRENAKEELRKKLFEELRSNQEFLGNPLRYIVTEVLGLKHYGDEIAKKTGMLTIVTAWLPDEYHAHCAITGPSSSGKSNLLKALYECVPKSVVLGGVLRVSSSPKALFYAGRREEVGKTIRHVLEVHHKVVFYAEPTMFYNNTPEGSLARELFKLLLSDTEEEELLCHDTVDPDRMVYRQYCVDGRPVVITTIPDENLSFLSGQESSRLLLVSIDLNPEVEAETLRFIRRKSRFKEEFKRRALLVRFFLSLMPIVESVELDEEADRFIDDLLMSYIGGERIEKHIRRAEQDLESLAAAYELLNYTAKLIQEGKKPPRKLEKLIVGKEAVKYVWEILKDAFEAKVYGNPLKGDKARIYKLIRDRGGPVRVAEILETVSLSKKTVYTILRELLDEGRITPCGRGIYALPGKCGQSITNYVNEKQDNAQQGGEGGGSP
jgi:energy-coupling factor transporter ATP-binding protein EcfA2